MSDLILEVNALKIHTEGKDLVKDIYFRLLKNNVLGLVGESGSGKTLSALSILGLIPSGLQHSGEIIFHNGEHKINLLGLEKDKLNRIRGSEISMIFQEPMTSLNPSMRCGFQVMEPLMKQANSGKSSTKKRVIELFNEVRLPRPEKLFNSWPHELSGGQRQRVMIAMALSTNPKILIADEPTTALDVTVQKRILDLLSELKQKYNLSILFISHDLQVVSQLCDNIAVMHDGQIIEFGSQNEIINSPKEPYTKGLLSCKPKLNEKPFRLPTIAQFMENATDRSLKSNVSAIPNDKQILFSIKNLSVSYGSGKKKFRAVKNLNFDVYEGETLGIVGESGCGKTTLGRAILQLITPENGSVYYRETPLNQMKKATLRKFRSKIQIVFQDPFSSLNPGKTAGYIISEPFRLHQKEKNKSQITEKVIDLMEQVGLPSESFHKYPHQFSGGQKQRIGIARALACKPEFIILDESVSALDVSIQAQVLNLLNDLKETYHLTYVFISHDLTIVKYMSDRVLVMADGKIVEKGTAEEIYNSPSELYTKSLISAIP